ncbi:MAG: DMT family transporter [Hyphomicrobiaceae bacterium]
MSSETLATAAGDNRTRGILLCVLAMLLFASANGFLKVALEGFAVMVTMMLRLWALLFMALVIAAMRGGVRAALRARRPVLQIARGGFLVTDQLVFTVTLLIVGLVEVSALYATTPLMAMALAVPILGERITWRHWLAVGVAFAGALLIVRPGSAVFQPSSLLVLGGALMYALYAISTRLASRTDSHETSLLYTSLAGVVVTTPLALLDWRTGDLQAWTHLVISLALSLAAHAAVIRAYALAPAGVLQPFNYLGLAASVGIGVVFLGEHPDLIVYLGTGLIVVAGLYIAWRESRSA